MTIQNGPLPLASQLWLPPNDFHIDAPHCSQTWYVNDQKQFSALGKHRQALIRVASFGEFPGKECSASAPPLWILVTKVGEWHFRVPIWRGPEFFRTTLLSDVAVMLTAADCVSRGGYDRAAVDEWKARVCENADSVGL